MTAQINDTCFHQEIEFKIAAVSGMDLFHPKSLGVQPARLSSACHRGFVTTYSILNKQFYLTKLVIGISRGRPPRLFDVAPNFSLDYEATYEGFQHPFPFTGSLILVKNFVARFRQSVGPNPAWAYQQARKTIFESGYLVGENNLDEEMEQTRLKFEKSARH